jgi:hypothetical protein
MYAREAEEIAWKIRAARMEDEGSAHSEGSAEKAGLKLRKIERGFPSLANSKCKSGVTENPIPASGTIFGGHRLDFSGAQAQARFFENMALFVQPSDREAHRQGGRR